MVKTIFTTETTETTENTEKSKSNLTTATRRKAKNLNYSDTAGMAKTMRTVVNLFFAFAFRRVRRVAVVKLLLLFAESTENENFGINQRFPNARCSEHAFQEEE
jgi:hypothetical protein